MDLAVEIYRITKSFPNEELYGLTSQLRRAGNQGRQTLLGYVLGWDQHENHPEFYLLSDRDTDRHHKAHARVGSDGAASQAQA